MEQKMQLSFSPTSGDRKEATETDIPVMMIKMGRQQTAWKIASCGQKGAESCENDTSHRILLPFLPVISLNCTDLVRYYSTPKYHTVFP
jgi:hypothetical protein